jgi:hypothetical protein
MCVYSHFSLPHINIGLNLDIFLIELNHGAWGGHFHFITNGVQKKLKCNLLDLYIGCQ